VALNIIDTIGNTPYVVVDSLPNYYAKLEGTNPFGSIKDRAAIYVMQKGYEQGIISKKTEIIESSSGNFAIALAAVCQLFGNKFTCVVDPNLTPLNQLILQSYGAKIVMASHADENGSFLRNRLDIVKDLIKKNPNLYWTNQYDNKTIREAYSNTIGKELIRDFQAIDFLFIPVSTCGTISGLSKKMKEAYPSIKIIAVDIVGSKIFDNHTKEKRYVPGMGASITPGNLNYAIIDEIVLVSEKEAINHCRSLLKKSILVGGSSGATSAAIEKYFDKSDMRKTIVAIFPDRGERYFSNIFNDAWCDEKILKKRETDVYAIR